jgi:hypothetical protein
MTFSIYDASAPIFARAMTNMVAWMDKAIASGADEKALAEARLYEDMRPFTFQIQAASDSAKNGVARLIGMAAPSMPDTETTFAELKVRCQKTVDYIHAIKPEAFDGAAERMVEMKFPNGMGYRFTGAEYLTGFALPNFFFHHTTAYAILRAKGVPMGKPDYLQHLGAPHSFEPA